MKKRRQEEADLAEFQQQKAAKEEAKQKRAEYMREKVLTEIYCTNEKSKFYKRINIYFEFNNSL